MAFVNKVKKGNTLYDIQDSRVDGGGGGTNIEVDPEIEDWDAVKYMSDLKIGDDIYFFSQTEIVTVSVNTIDDAVLYKELTISQLNNVLATLGEDEITTYGELQDLIDSIEDDTTLQKNIASTIGTYYGFDRVLEDGADGQSTLLYFEDEPSSTKIVFYSAVSSQIKTLSAASTFGNTVTFLGIES